MIHTLALTKDMKLIEDLELSELDNENIEWYWVDFDCPNKDEAMLLDTHFHFHPLAIEDCMYLLQRPKIDSYDDYIFFVFQALKEDDLEPIELDLFLGSNYAVTFHNIHLSHIDVIDLKIKSDDRIWSEGSLAICYHILNKIVEDYFPVVYRLEDVIDEIEANVEKATTIKLLDKIFDVRSDLLIVLRIVNQMEELLYRILASENLKKKHLYFSDIHDHLLKLKEMIESSQAISSEIRDSYISYNSYRMNKNMMLLTVITAIFIPLTFIVGVYGMNFKYMPELEMKSGYFIVLGGMLVIVVLMIIWFKMKGWFDIDK
ncbi:MAG: magnesium and cobalt transport protein CorA [Firmicutes bacterium HGW-Firmicutes-1]|jgi:magnesium transporter|nr:MAG: magnesium and cobalt transport protein CorA [Firmicutes bacterium HGW-Firmicutes-1]